MTIYIIIAVLMYLLAIFLGLPFFEHIYHKLRKEKFDISDDDTKMHDIMHLYFGILVGAHLPFLVILLKEWLNQLFF